MGGYKKCPCLSWGTFWSIWGLLGPLFTMSQKGLSKTDFWPAVDTPAEAKNQASTEQRESKASTEPAQSQHRASTIAQRMPSKHRTAIEQESNREQEPHKTVHCSPDGGGGCVADGVCCGGGGDGSPEGDGQWVGKHASGQARSLGRGFWVDGIGRQA